MNTTELLIIGFTYIISIVVSFICGEIFAVRQINEMKNKK